MRNSLFRLAIAAVIAAAVPASLAGQQGKASTAKTPWGHPDLEGIWTTDDMRGIPMSRPAQYGTRSHLTDEEFGARAKERLLPA